jgi:hypothetical protein
VAQAPRWLPEHPAETEAVEPVLGGARPPLLAQAMRRQVVILAPAGVERRDLRRARRALAAGRHVLEHLPSALGEVVDHLARYAGDVGHPVLDRVPADVEALGHPARETDW